MNVRLILAGLAMLVAAASVWGQEDSDPLDVAPPAGQAPAEAAPAAAAPGVPPANMVDPVEELKRFFAERFDNLSKKIDTLTQQSAVAREELRVELSTQLEDRVKGLATVSELRNAEMALSQRVDEAAREARQQLAASVTTQVEQATAGMVTQAELDEIRRDIRSMKNEMEQLASTLGSLSGDIAQLRSELNTTEEQLRQSNADIGQILREVTSLDSSTRAPRLAIRSIMEKSPEFAQEMADAVHTTMRQTGRLVIDNKMNTPQTVTINNNARYSIDPGQRRIVEGIPVGTVTTQLEGGLQKSWTLSPPKYEQGIDIVPVQNPSVVLGPGGVPMAVQ